jgi:hypothetical protein
LNQDRTDDAMDAIVDTCRRETAREGFGFECLGVGSDMTFEL